MDRGASFMESHEFLYIDVEHKAPAGPVRPGMEAWGPSLMVGRVNEICVGRLVTTPSLQKDESSCNHLIHKTSCSIHV